MGDRANVRFQDDGEIYFYTHWSGYELEATVASALKRSPNRWDDGQYLARIVFCEMVKGREMEETGYGISAYIGDGEDRVVTINVQDGTVSGFDGEPLGFPDYIAKHLEPVPAE